MSLVIQVNDVHTSDRPPRWRRASYNDELFTKLDYVVHIANHEDAVLLFCGDLFHHPAPSKVSHELVNRWLDLLRRAGPVVIVPGNHDLAFGRIGSLYRQPLATLGTLPNVHILHSGNSYTTPDGELICGVEWNYSATPTWVAQTLMDREHNVKEGIDLLAIHAAIAKEPNPHYETLQPDQLCFARVVAFGHLHPPEEPYAVNQSVFVNPGALSRGSLTESDLTRTPQVARIDLKTKEVRMIPVPAKPASEVFSIALAEAKKGDTEAVDKFVESMRETALESVSVESLVEEVRKRTDDPDVIATAEGILLSL